MHGRIWLDEINVNDAASDHSSDTDMPIDAMGWTSVHYRKSGVPRYGRAGDYIGRSFRWDLKPKAVSERAIIADTDPFRESRIVGIVIKRDSEFDDSYMKFCREDSIGENDVLPEDPACYSYDLAKTMMSASKANVYKWRATVAEITSKRRQRSQDSSRRQRRRTWAYVDQDGNEVDDNDLDFHCSDTEDED